MTTPTLTLSPAVEERQPIWRTLSNAWIVTRREVRDSLRDWRIIVPILILTFAFPFLAQFLAGRFLSFVSDFGAEIIGERTIPFLLMIVGFFPISISLVIALETFVGEKERKSLEPLLSTPLTNTELYIGKTLAAMIPPLISSLGGMAVYLVILLASELAWRPAVMLVVQIMLLTVVQALVMVTGAVVVSSLTTSTRAANLLASFIIIPMSLMIQAETFIMFFAPDAESPLGIGALWAIIGGMLVATILLLRVGNGVFNREELLGRNIDQLNLRGLLGRIGGGTLALESGARARNLLEWYRAGVWPAVRRLGLAVPVVVVVFIGAFLGGILLGQQPEWQLNLPQNVPMEQVVQQFGGLLDTGTKTQAVFFIIEQNGRILLAAILIGIFTFGVGALILTPAVYVIIGYLLTQVLAAGFTPGFMAAGILTHGIVEIPTIILATAAGLRMGAVVTRVPEGMTVGRAWTNALSDTIKIGLGVLLPGLVLAALIESFITPQIVLRVLGG